MRHLITVADLKREEIEALYARAKRLKADHQQGRVQLTLAGKVLGLIFEKPSMRTRVSFEAAMVQLGGGSLFLSGNEVGLGTRESIADFARVISEYVDGVVLRTFAHQKVESFATHAGVPVINGLSDYNHPCQALSDLFTVEEVFGSVDGRTIAFIGDGNNTARSLAVGCGLLGARFRLAAPQGYGFDSKFLEEYQQRFPKDDLELDRTPAEAVRGADVIYTDVWASMGQEAERADRLRAFANYQISEKLLALAPAHAVVMHCLPAHRGEEITDAVLDGPRSIVFQQAGNRMHVQKALLEWLLGDQNVRSLPESIPKKNRPGKQKRAG